MNYLELYSIIFLTSTSILLFFLNTQGRSPLTHIICLLFSSSSRLTGPRICVCPLISSPFVHVGLLDQSVLLVQERPLLLLREEPKLVRVYRLVAIKPQAVLHGVRWRTRWPLLGCRTASISLTPPELLVGVLGLHGRLGDVLALGLRDA